MTTSPSTTDRPPRLVVIGGGISGLAAALELWDLAQAAGTAAEITLLDAETRVGGVFGSERIGAYLIERGADSFITNKPHALELCRRLKLENRLVSTSSEHRGSLILHHGVPVPTPAGFNLMAPARLGPMLSTPLLSWAGKARLAAEYFVPPRTDPSDESVAAFVRRRFGREVLDNIVQPLVGGIYTSDPEQLSLRATLPRFVDMEQQHGSLIRAMRRGGGENEHSSSASGARYGLFVTLRNGMQELLDTLHDELDGKVKLRLGSRVERLERWPLPELAASDSHRCWRLTLSSGPVVEADGIIIALPAPAAASLLQSVDVECADTLRKIPAASSAIVVTAHTLSEIDHPLNAFGLVIPHKERRKILAVSFLSRKFPDRAPPGQVILRTFVGGALQPEEFDRTDEEMVANVCRELRSVLGVRGTPEFAVVARYPGGMPQYTLGHLDRVARIFSRIQTIPQLELAGNAYTGVGLPDCIASGQQAARRLWREVAGRV